MSGSTISAPVIRPGKPADTPAPAVVAARRPLIFTPLFTRHMLGAIEADRDRRRLFRGAHPRRRHPAGAMAHPRIAAAAAANALAVTEAHLDFSRWADEGGRFDPDAAARLRNGHKETKRCSS